jgi:hypothetical protein
MLNRRKVLGATVVVGVMNLGAAAAWAQAGRKAATPDELRHLIGRATRLSVLSDRITRCQAQKSLQVLTTRADKVLADATDDVRRGLAELTAAGLTDASKALVAPALKSYETFLGHSQQLDVKNAKALGAFAEEADVVGDHMDALVASLIKDLGQSVAKVLASTADLQRLTQHTAVHFLMARLGINEAEQLKVVAEGRKEFNEKLQVLQAAPLKNPAIEAQLQLLAPQWLLMANALGQSGNDAKTLENISTTSERLLEVSTSLYALYESALKA